MCGSNGPPARSHLPATQLSNCGYCAGSRMPLVVMNESLWSWFFALWPLVAAWLLWKRTPAAGAHACPRCGYDLRATPDRCPECGAVADPRPSVSHSAEQHAHE